MEDQFKSYLFGFILVCAFGMLCLTAVTIIGSNYSMDMTTIDGSLSIDKFNESVVDVESDAMALKERFDQQSIWSAIVGIVVEGIFGIVLTIFQMMFLPLDIIFGVMINVLGVPAWLTSILLGLIIMGVIFAIWRLLKIGD